MSNNTDTSRLAPHEKPYLIPDVLDVLAETYKPAGVNLRMGSPNRRLGYRTPTAAIVGGDIDEVYALACSLGGMVAT